MGRPPADKAKGVRPRCAALERLEGRRLLSGFAAHVHFQPANVAVPSGYLADVGAPFAVHDNGLSYGWNGPRAAQVGRSHAGHDKGIDPLYESFAVLNHGGRGSRWQIAIADGEYRVHILAGDPSTSRGLYQIASNGTTVLNGRATPNRRFVEGTQTVTVTNGMLAITSAGKNGPQRIDAVDIVEIAAPTVDQPPSSDPAPVTIPPAVDPPPVSLPPPPASSGSPPSHLANVNWEAVAPSPVAMAEGMGASVGGRIYVFGGYSATTPSWQATNQLAAYDPAANSWHRLADMPARLSEAAVVTDGTSIYVAGGYVTNAASGQQTFATASVWRYDTVNDKWSNFVALPAARAVGAMVLLGRQLHYFGGSDANRVDCADHWTLNLDDASPQWTASTPLPAGRNRFGAAVLNGRIYALGGQTSFDGDAIPKSDVFVWDPQTPGVWTAAAPLPLARSHLGAAVCAIDNHLIIAGGDSSVGHFLANVTAYDPLANAWSDLTPLPQPRLATVLVSTGDELFATDGYDQGMQSDAWKAALG